VAVGVAYISFIVTSLNIIKLFYIYKTVYNLIQFIVSVLIASLFLNVNNVNFVNLYGGTKTALINC
jgi:hypothetical protein